MKNRLDQLEKEERGPRLPGSAAASTASSVSSERPLGAARFAGFVPSATAGASDQGIDRARFYGGSHPEMPRASVQQQLETAKGRCYDSVGR